MGPGEGGLPECYLCLRMPLTSSGPVGAGIASQLHLLTVTSDSDSGQLQACLLRYFWKAAAAIHPSIHCWPLDAVASLSCHRRPPSYIHLFDLPCKA